MKKLTIIIIALISLVSCNCQDYETLKQQLTEKLDSLELVKNQNIVLKDSIEFYKAMYDFVNPYSDTAYAVKIKTFDELGSSYMYKQDGQNMWFERFNNGEVLRMQLVNNNIEYWYGKDVDDETWQGNLVFRFDLNWFK